MQVEYLLCKGFLPETERIISFVVCAFEELDRITMLPLLNVRMRANVPSGRECLLQRRAMNGQIGSDEWNVLDQFWSFVNEAK